MATSVFPERGHAQKLVSQLAEKLSATFTETTARSLLSLEFAEPAPERRQELAEKANEGLLSKEEYAEYETYAHLRGLLAILQSKARLFLAKQSGA